MHNDNVMPNDGRYFAATVVSAQKKITEEEIEATLNQLPLLREVLVHFDEQIKYLESIDSLDADLKADPQSHVNQVNANKLARNKLKAERSFILARVEKTIKR